MTPSHTYFRWNEQIASLLVGAVVLGIFFVGLTGCKKPSSATRAAAIASPSEKDVIGLTEAELRGKYPQVTELDNSFDLLVSKNLHPYHTPATNKLLRFGSD